MSLVPSFVGAAIAWRTWKVEMLSLRSVSMTVDTKWDPGVAKTAQCFTKNAYIWTNVDDDDPRPCWLSYLVDQGIERCEGGRDISDYALDLKVHHCPKGKTPRLLPHKPAPCINHSCGVYGVTDVARLTPYTSYDRVIGTVSMWGDTVEADKGFRSQYAYPLELWVPCRPEDLDVRTRFAEWLAEEWQLEVHVGIPEEISKLNTQTLRETLVA